MNSKLSDLFYIIEKLIVVHRTLCDILDQEYSAMVQLDLETLSESSRSKETLIEEIWNLEQLRIKAVESLAEPFQQNFETISIATIIKYLEFRKENESKSHLERLRETLQMIVSRAKESNSRNMDFAKSSLSRIDELKSNVLGIASAASKENYSNQGTRTSVTEQGGRLLSTEA